MSRFVAVFVVFSGLAAPLAAENWPGWRGPNGNGVSAETNLPAQFGKDRNFGFRTALPGPAGATPVIWRDRIFLTSAETGGKGLWLLCLDTSGKILWKDKVTDGNKKVRGDEGNYASPSPVTDGKHVWVMFGNGVAACYDFAGKQVWKLSLPQRYGRLRIQFGLASTPVLHGERLFFQLIHGDGRANTQEAMVVCLDKSNGKELWKKSRVTGAERENEHSYASPMLYPFAKQPYLITHGADYAIAYQLADGKELWRLGGLNPRDDPSRRYHPTLRFVASPGFDKNLIVVPTAKNGPVFAIHTNKKGNLAKDAIAWSMRRGTPDVPTPLLYGGLTYLCRENGNLMCLESATGKEIYYEKTHRQRHRASPVYADGKVYLTARDGRITVVKAGRKFEVLATNEIGETIAASPAFANGVMYLRTNDALWAFKTAK